MLRETNLPYPPGHSGVLQTLEVPGTCSHTYGKIKATTGACKHDKENIVKKRKHETTTGCGGKLLGITLFRQKGRLLPTDSPQKDYFGTTNNNHQYRYHCTIEKGALVLVLTCYLQSRTLTF